MNDDALEDLARKCKWETGFEPPIGDPRNKDFIEADVKKIVEALKTLRPKTRKEDAEIAQDDDNIVECDGANSYYCQLGDAKATSFKIARAILKKDKEERDGR
jgi:hypothetical protein